MPVSRRVWIGLILVVIIAVASVIGYWTYSKIAAPSTKVFRVAMIAEGSLQDASWNQFCYNALQEIADLPGINVTFAENVGIADFGRVAGDYAAQGYDLIVAHTYDYMQAALATAKLYPKTNFIVYGADQFLPNLAGYGMYGNQGMYLAGMLGALMTKTNKTGIVLTFKYTVQLVELNGFISGVRAVNPNCTIYATFTGTWYDTTKGNEAAKAMISNGVDFISIISSGPGIGAIQAAQEAGIYATGAFTDMNYLAPNTVVTSVLYNAYNPFMTFINATKDGTFQGKSYDFEMPVGAITLAPYHNLDSVIPQGVKDKISTATAKIIDGSLMVPFIPNYELPHS